MAIARITTWSSGQTLTASALNAEFNNILNNGVDLWSPASKSTSFGGYALVLDAAGVSNVQSPGTTRLSVYSRCQDRHAWGVQAEPSTLPPIPIRIAPLPPAGQPPAGRGELQRPTLAANNTVTHNRCATCTWRMDRQRD